MTLRGLTIHEAYALMSKGKGRRRTKYGAKRCTTADGEKFDSKAERARWGVLLLMQARGEIERLERQPVYELVVNGVKVGRYVGDFRYFDVRAKRFVTEDVKGVKTPVYRLKKKLVAALHGIEIKETK